MSSVSSISSLAICLTFTLGAFGNPLNPNLGTEISRSRSIQTAYVCHPQDPLRGHSEGDEALRRGVGFLSLSVLLSIIIIIIMFITIINYY